ncbi:hypothetical protein Pcinc_032617 [Petrolisthes cinctipes]|uniref:Acetoacetyl-CoA synthetase n=1 Tax=Petrolisthes cinctipes TaxID=88211 RepID=A0AAE1EU22_PETCI|nr:hypothetical protein Pcinc_032617 [Petrolisthes cinctipes]
MDEFRETVNKKYRTKLNDYHALYNWSVEEYPDFWETWWEFGRFIHSSSHSQIVNTSLDITQIPQWFSGAKLNFAENLLRYRDDRVAIYATGEGQQDITTITYAELYQRVAKCTRALQEMGVTAGQRVAGYIPNCPAAVEMMLATAALGATWTSTSPDFGVTGVLERLHQVEPSVVVSVEAVVYNGKVHHHLDKLRKVVAGLPSLQKVIIIPFVHKKNEIDISDIPNSMFLEDLTAEWAEDNMEMEFVQVPFHHPLFIMFSSGTTGMPKCMVHSVGGTLLQIAKEHVLHCDLTRSDVFTYYTTTGWMMWNWLVVGLFSGCSLLLYEGSPLLPTPTIIWDLVDKLGVTVLGTGAKWLTVQEQKGVHPAESHDLSSLRAILSTGSPLAPHSFRYVYTHVKKDLLLGSISGGTDIISCFIGSNPSLPVYMGEIQGRNLGMAVEAWDDNGQPVFDERGDLVCTRPFPSMPTHFWNDDSGIKYTKAYFSKFHQAWTHGDYIIINSKTGCLTMLGRSDGTLNPNGVRFGSAEIYNIVELFKEVSDSVCVGQRKTGGGEERVVLFLKLHPDFSLTQDLLHSLVTTIRSQLSARHVPAYILPISEIPYTVSGKKVEVAVRQVLEGIEVKNRDALSNPDSLNHYANIPTLSGW